MLRCTRFARESSAINLTLECTKNNGNIPLTRIKLPAWWLLLDTSYAFLSPLYFIKCSCFQNVQEISVFKVNFLSSRKKYSGAFIILSETSRASHYHFTWCDLFVFSQTSIGYFSFIYFVINLTFVLCNRPQASCFCI